MKSLNASVIKMATELTADRKANGTGAEMSRAIVMHIVEDVAALFVDGIHRIDLSKCISEVCRRQSI